MTVELGESQPMRILALAMLNDVTLQMCKFCTFFYLKKFRDSEVDAVYQMSYVLSGLYCLAPSKDAQITDIVHHLYADCQFKTLLVIFEKYLLC